MRRPSSDYKKLFALHSEISSLMWQKTRTDEVRSTLARRLRSIKRGEIVNTVASLHALMEWVDLGISIKEIVDFIHKHASDIVTGDLWQIIELEEYDELEAKTYFYTVEVALIILWVLEGQKSVESRICNSLGRGSIHPSVALAIYDVYTYHVHVEKYNSVVFYGSFFNELDYDFIFQLVRYIFDITPREAWGKMRDKRDQVLEDFRNLYYTAPYGLSHAMFVSLLQSVEEVHDDNWRKAVGISKEDAVDFIRIQYQYHYEGWDHSLIEYDELCNRREDLKKLSGILICAKFKRTRRDQMEQFIAKNSISLYWQVRILAEDDETRGEGVRKFIDYHLPDFSYEELLRKVVTTFASEHIQYALYIILKQKGPERVLNDIIENFRAGAITKPKLEYLLYACGGFNFYIGTEIDKKFYEGLKSFIDDVKVKRANQGL